MESGRSLSIVIPAYCEALASLGLTHEILVVDDGSPDGTGELVTATLFRFANVWRSRTWRRTVISKTFTGLVNLIAQRGLPYALPWTASPGRGAARTAGR
jgi:glycosyltransferase involved in cell wall biosynthesis